MDVVTPPASPALAPFVEALWYVEKRVPHGRERVLPSGGMQLLVNLGEDELRSTHGATVRRTRGAALQGANAEPVVIDTAHRETIMGVAFRPGGAYPFFPAPASATRGDLVEVDALWEPDGALLRERLLEAATPAEKLRELEVVLLAHVICPLAPDRARAFAVAALDYGMAVDAVADRLGMTPKRLARRFAGEVGLTPKLFARVRRFQRLLLAVADGVAVDWARLAAECGYYDQAHLIHDFRAFSGMTPGAYQARSAWERNHVPLPD